jgi:hypothetical protein
METTIASKQEILNWRVPFWTVAAVIYAPPYRMIIFILDCLGKLLAKLDDSSLQRLGADFFWDHQT